MKNVGEGLLKEIYARRPRKSRKGDFGKLLVIGGSKKYTGAPALVSFSAITALRSGTDLVTVAAPKRAADVVAKFSPNLITEPFDCNYFSRKHVKKILKLSKDYDAVSIGSGIGMKKSTQDFVKDVIRRLSKPCVADADAIKSLKGIRKIGANVLLTPHAYEFYHISGEKPRYDVMGRAGMVAEFARSRETTVLLKGPTDIISDGRQTAINKTGNPYMTTGGTGDVLAGVCGGLLAQGIEPFKAACAAAYITGKAGDLAAKSKGAGLMATDVIDSIPNVIRRYGKWPERR